MARMRCLVPAGLLAAAVPFSAAADQGADKRPSLALRASPQVATAPARIVVSAEIRGGADDARELYCPTLEWDWGDGTRSSASSDCEPYQPGKSQIRRRFVMDHIYRLAGQHQIQLRLKQGERVVLAGTTVVHVRPGLGG